MAICRIKIVTIQAEYIGSLINRWIKLQVFLSRWLVLSQTLTVLAAVCVSIGYLRSKLIWAIDIGLN